MQALVLVQAQVLGLVLVQGQVQLLPQDQVLGQAHLVQGQKQVHMLGLEPGQDHKATKEVDQALVRVTVRVVVRVLVEEVALVKVLVMVKAVAMALGLEVGMENEVT